MQEQQAIDYNKVNFLIGSLSLKNTIIKEVNGTFINVEEDTYQGNDRELIKQEILKELEVKSPIVKSLKEGMRIIT